MPTYDNVTQWKILPIYRFILFFPTPPPVGTAHIFLNLVQGSTFSFRPIYSNVKANNGFNRVVGFQVEGTIIIPQNNIGDLWETLNAIITQKPDTITLDLLDKEYLKIVFSNNSNFSFDFEIEYDDNIMGPVVKINFRGMLNKNTIEENTFKGIFNQFWS